MFDQIADANLVALDQKFQNLKPDWVGHDGEVLGQQISLGDRGADYERCFDGRHMLIDLISDRPLRGKEAAPSPRTYHFAGPPYATHRMRVPLYLASPEHS